MNRNKILVPVDFKNDSAMLLSFAGSMAQSINARLSCVYVANNKPENRLNHQKLIVSLAEKINTILKNNNVDYDFIVTKGDFVNRIAEIAKGFSFNYIILGKSWKSKFTKISELSGVAVVLVPEQKKELEADVVI